MENFLDELAKATPTPASGAASCYVGAEAAALLEMIAGFAAKKGQSSGEALVERGRELRHAFLMQAAQDSAAYTQVISAYRLPKDAADRGEAIARALREATLSPLAVLDLAVALIEAIREVEAICPRTMRSDWECAVVLCGAAVDVSAKNAAANFDGAADADVLRHQLDVKLRRIAEITPQV